ncbi:carbon storage regulator [Tuwongella immobilis]|uniref:Translational regulator CsrA n=1 Tax=Tuwongella immobilis TaxID=692036 RepID=A0A6C2YQJ5_9BACT|nr:carbon storage regulator [Tuwongella immobilis]VIP03429.1 carbon storage regulator : Carbon storage regulator homolog OS=Paenibacillus alvei DSM 29 GN=csrA PE=3 SV=1: CsrA [Tuwongella immobilis]VTS04230.1 carbon storage regulator : Carbon storage regulator homolog OS=Paenibacillus alvei DSM 29 GN=csrA PE=3 SV=1: CsrA [Tuwongella immobilis]
MLVLTRQKGQKIVIDNHITLTVISVQGDKVRIGIQAPPEVRVDREEISQLRRDEAEIAPQTTNATPAALV